MKTDIVLQKKDCTVPTSNIRETCKSELVIRLKLNNMIIDCA